MKKSDAFPSLLIITFYAYSRIYALILLSVIWRLIYIMHIWFPSNYYISSVNSTLSHICIQDILDMPVVSRLDYKLS